MKKWLIRHGESISNLGEITKDAQNIPLSENGVIQAENLISILPANPEVVILSSYERAVQTCRHCLIKCREKGWTTSPKIDVSPVHEFTYLSSKKYNNTSPEQRKPAANAYWDLCDPNYCDATDEQYVESFNQLMGRVKKFQLQLESYSDKFVTAFTHGQFMKAFWWYMFNSYRKLNEKDTMIEVAQFMNCIRTPNTCILEVDWEKDFQNPSVKLITSHLKF